MSEVLLTVACKLEKIPLRLMDWAQNLPAGEYRVKYVIERDAFLLNSKSGTDYWWPES